MYYGDNYNKKSETEGFKGRTLTLYHMTSKEAASSIVRSQDMTPGSSGMFGGGIYFAETREACSRKARHTEVLLKAEVQVGISLICRDHDRGTSYKRLLSENGCDSVKAVGCVSSPEYVVYKSSQVTNIQYADDSRKKKFIKDLQEFKQGLDAIQSEVDDIKQLIPRNNVYLDNFATPMRGNVILMGGPRLVVPANNVYGFGAPVIMGPGMGGYGAVFPMGGYFGGWL